MWCGIVNHIQRNENSMVGIGLPSHRWNLVLIPVSLDHSKMVWDLKSITCHFAAIHMQVYEIGGKYLYLIGSGFLWLPMILLAEVVQTFILADFCYYYIKRWGLVALYFHTPAVTTYLHHVGDKSLLIYSDLQCHGRPTCNDSVFSSLELWLQAWKV